VKTRSFLFCALLVCCCSVGQERLDLVTLTGNYGFPAAYDSLYQSKGTEKGIMASAVAPVELNERSIWYNSINYFYWSVDNDEPLSENIMNPIEVHGFVLRSGLMQQLKEQRYFQLIFAPRLMTDFQNIGSDHFQIGGIALYGKQYKPSLKIGFGVLFNQEFFGPNVVPLIDLDWKITNKWSLVGLFPVYGKLTYKAHPKLDMGWSHFGLVTTYRLGAAEYSGDYIDRRSIDETLYARYQLFGNFFIEGRFGYSFGRSYTQYSQDQKVDLTLPLISIGDDREAKTASIQSGFISSLRIVYSIPLENSP
jgi:hypothetical protein